MNLRLWLAKQLRNSQSSLRSKHPRRSKPNRSRVDFATLEPRMMLSAVPPTPVGLTTTTEPIQFEISTPTIAQASNGGANHFVVNTIGDKPDSDLTDGVAQDVDGNTSLRAAIEQANASAGMMSQIDFDITDGSGTEFVIQLDSALPFVSSMINLNGASQVGADLVVDGSAITANGTDGLRILSDGVEVSDLEFTGFTSDGIEIFHADSVVIDSVIGSDNGNAGIRFNDSTQSQVINSVFTGNAATGVQLVGATVDQGNLISNNRVGLDLNDVEDGNLKFGVQVLSGGNDIIDNVISGNNKSGLVISGVRATNNEVYGNLIGTDSTGTTAVANQAGILVTNADNNIIGGTGTGQRNIVSGNNGAGAFISGGASGTHFENNFVGLNLAGTAAIANGGSGVFLRAGATQSLVTGNRVAGNTLSQISVIALGTTGNTISANHVGFAADGSRIDGGNVGIFVSANGNTIGGATATDGNFVTGSNVGISLSRSRAYENVIQNNVVGTDAAGGDFGMTSGIQFLQSPRDNSVLDNVFAFNSGDAIRSPTGGEGNTFSRNQLFASAFGIDLGGNGLTANDVGDADTGPNLLQNSPGLEPDALLIIAPDSTAEISVGYNLDSDPANSAYSVTIEFFLSDPTGTDAFFVGSDIFTTADYSAGVKFVTLPSVSIDGLPLDSLVATATDSDGNTSELSLSTNLILDTGGGGGGGGGIQT